MDAKTEAQPQIAPAESEKLANQKTEKASDLNSQLIESLLEKTGIKASDLERMGVTQEKLSADQPSADLIKLLIEKQKESTEKANSILGNMKENAVSQVRQFGASTLASIIAILIAVVSPLILNSQFVKDIKQTIADIRTQLPNEADKLLMDQVTELSKNNQGMLNTLSSQQLLLQEKSVSYQQQSEQFQQAYQQMSQKIVALETRNQVQVDNTDTIAALQKQLESLKGQVNSTHEGPNRALYQQLVKLSDEGKGLTATQSEKADVWFKKLFYTIQGLQKNEANQQLSSHVEVLKSIANRDNGFNDFNKRKQEALIILNALSSLVNAAVIG